VLRLALLPFLFFGMSVMPDAAKEEAAL